LSGPVIVSPRSPSGNDARVQYEAMDLRIRDVVGAGLLACILIGLVALYVVGNIPAAK
jgi:hypothetical protein